MKIVLSLYLVLIVLSGCASEPSKEAPTGQPSFPTPGITSIASPSPSTAASPSPTRASVTLSTTTPTLYTVVLNDNLSSIAKKFGLTLEELLAANPTIGSQPLTVGTILTIPTGQSSSTESTVTPIPLAIQQVQCYPNLDGSLYCLALLKNEYAETLQNLSGSIELVAQDGTILDSQIAHSPLDLLPPGKSIPISVLFPAPILQGSQPQARIITASLLPSPGSTYPAISIISNLVEIDWGGLNAHVSGKTALATSGLKASRVWILAIAYDQEGKLVGFSRWESKTNLSFPDHLPFDFSVSSLGPPIEHVDLLVEAVK